MTRVHQKMKVKITLLLAQCNTKKTFRDEDYFKIYLTDKNKFPCKFVSSSKNEKQTLKEICQKHFKIDYEWMKKELMDFRIIKDPDGNLISEVVYITYVPEVLGMLKNGKLMTENEVIESKIELEDFYADIFSKRGRSIFR